MHPKLLPALQKSPFVKVNEDYLQTRKILGMQRAWNKSILRTCELVSGYSGVKINNPKQSKVAQESEDYERLLKIL
jgi:hypothetical protein